MGSLLHDIGHLVGMDQSAERMITGDVYLGVNRHDVVGETFLSELGVPEAVSCFSRGHIDAKRYLTYKDPEYHESKSSCLMRFPWSFTFSSSIASARMLLVESKPGPFQ